MTKNNDVNIINQGGLGSAVTFTDVGVKGSVYHAEASRATLHTNASSWLETSTTGLSGD